MSGIDLRDVVGHCTNMGGTAMERCLSFESKGNGRSDDGIKTLDNDKA